MFDDTPDVSHKEKMSQVLRYVYISNGVVTIENTYMDIIESHEKIDEELALEKTEKRNQKRFKIR